MSKETIDDTTFARISRALADPRRYEVLQCIAKSEEKNTDATCTCILGEVPIAAATLSHHIKELEGADLITIEKKGKFHIPHIRRDVWKAYVKRLKQL